MKNSMTAPGSSTCRHFSIRDYVRQRQMSNSTLCLLSDEHINSPLVTTKTYLRWNCKCCRDKLKSLHNKTLARTLNESARVPEHAVHKGLSQEKGSVKCLSPSSDNEESTEVDRAINDLHESMPINQENGSVKYLSPSWGNKESADANPVVNGTDFYESTPINQENGSTKYHSPSWCNKESVDANPVVNGLDEASTSNPDGTKKMPSNVDDTNLPDTCQKIKEKKEINDKEKLEFMHGEPMLGISKKCNSVKSLPVKRKDETNTSLHNNDKNVIKTYKRRRNTKVQDFINESSFVDCQDRSESNKAGNSKEKHVISIMQPDASLLCPSACLSEANIHTTNIMDGDERIQNNGAYKTPCSSSENELECSKMYLSKVSPGKTEQTHGKITEDEDECVRISVKEASTRVQSEKSKPDFFQLEQQQSQHLHNELPLSTTEDCIIISVNEVSARLQSEKSQNHLSRKECQDPEFTWLQHQQFQNLHNEVSLRNATEDEEGDCVITSVKNVSTRLQSGESHNQYNGENFTSYKDNSSLNGSFPPTIDIYAKDQHRQNFSKPFRPIPRIGVLSVMLQKEVATYLGSCGTQSGYRLGMLVEETPFQIYRGENLILSSSQEVPGNCTPHHLGYATSVAIPKPVRESSHWTKGKSKMVDPSDKSSEQDICALSLSLSLSL